MDNQSKQGTVQIALRITPDLRERIKAAADARQRSVNSELTATLERAYPSEDAVKAALRHAASLLQDQGFSEDEAWSGLTAEMIKSGAFSFESDKERDQAVTLLRKQANLKSSE